MGGTDMLVSSWAENLKTVPANYVLTPEKRPQIFSVCDDIPVIDLVEAESGEGRADLQNQIVKASHEYGIFQVINHGITEEMQAARNIDLEFFKTKSDEKEKLYAADVKDGVRLHTSGQFYSSEEIHFWKDTLNLPCYPLEDHIESWPKNPPQFREVMGTYAVEVRKLALRIAEVIGAGLGLEHGYFAVKYTDNHGIFINLYPPCPDPSLTLGLGIHCDPFIITLVQQDSYGLQVTNRDGQWVGIDYVPNAFMVIIGNSLEVISNGKLRSCVHRVVTNSEVNRLSIISFIYPDHEFVVRPSQELMTANELPLYNSIKYKDLLGHYFMCTKTKIHPLTTVAVPSMDSIITSAWNSAAHIV